MNDKQKYNKLLERFKNAEVYYDRPDVSHEEKEATIDGFCEIMRGLNFHLMRIADYTETEILGGFKDAD